MIQPVSTSLGRFEARYSASGLATIDFPGRPHPAPPGLTAPSPEGIALWHPLTEEALVAITSGRPAHQLPPLDLSGGSAFQQAVWRELLGIPFGHTRTYGEIAQALGNPAASRAVGAACGANPIPVIIPCHRVMAAHGRLGGFSGGLDWKRRLLQAEGVLLA